MADDVGASDGKRISCTLRRFIIVAQIHITLQPLHDLLHFTIPIGLEDNQAAEGTVTNQSESETNPETQ